ncbi:MAG: hypothetical protein EOO38_27430, partial [Cytophagaceae bacterium]
MPASFDNVARNPVGRLHHLLIQMPSDQTRMGDWLATYFAIQPRIASTSIELYANLALLVVECQRAARIVPHYPEEDLVAFREPIREVASVVVSHNANSSIYQFKNQISAETLKGLEFFSRILNREKPEVAVDPTQLEGLLVQVQKLIADIMGSDIDPELKALLVEHLQAVEKSLRFYSILGSAGLRRAAAGLMGGTYI